MTNITIGGNEPFAVKPSIDVFAINAEIKSIPTATYFHSLILLPIKGNIKRKSQEGGSCSKNEKFNKNHTGDQLY